MAAITLNPPQAELRFAINLGNPVLAQMTPQGTPAGLAVALAGQIAQHLNQVPQFITYDSAQAVVNDAARQRFDIAFLAVDPQRESLLRFTPPYVTIEGTMMVPQNSLLNSTQAIDCPGNVINVGHGAAYDLYLSRTLSQATLNRYASSQEAIDMFLRGQGDMVAGIRQVLACTAEQDPRFRVLPDSFTHILQAVCVPRGDERFFAVVETRLEKMKQEGTLDALIQRYMQVQ